MLSNSPPQTLQNKVFFEMMLHFGRCGREGLRSLTKDNIMFRLDDNSCEYATIRHNELDKTRQVVQPKEMEKKQVMYAQTDDPECPVQSLKLYLSKLHPQCPFLFQKPKSGRVNELDVWYQNRVLGIHKIDNMMKDISKSAGLSQLFTNHCIRATSTTVLSQAGVQARNIMSVTGHKNEGSLKSYASTPCSKERADMCNILHKFGKVDTDSVNQSSASTSTSSNSALVVHTTKENTEIVSSSAVFSGANFNGSTTINVQINQK